MAKKTTLEIPDFLKDKYRHIGTGEPWGDHKIELPNDKIFDNVVAIMRANPLHMNHTLMLRRLCDQAVYAKINLGSSNKFNEKNPFKIEEREQMVKIALRDYDNFDVLGLPDFGQDDEWFQCLYKNNKPFSEVLSNNQSDLKIYERYQEAPGYDRFDIIYPTDILPQEDMLYVDGIWDKGKFIQARKPMYTSGTFVRATIVNNWNWQDFLDKKVAEYIKKNGLDTRLKQMCKGLEGITLAKLEEDR